MGESGEKTEQSFESSSAQRLFYESPMARIAVVMPAYNEECFVSRAIRGVPAEVFRIVVVDDASTDATAAAARATGDARVRVVVHPENAGVGAAITTGYRAAFADGADIAVVMAGDGQMDGRDLPRLIAPIVEGRADYCKGDRLSHPRVLREMPLVRFVGNHVLSFLTRAATGLPVSDSQCGYTALSRSGFDHLARQPLWPRYGYPNDWLGVARLSGVRVADVVVSPIYAEEASGIGFRHALCVIPFLLFRAMVRRATSVRLAPTFVRAETVDETVRTSPPRPASG